MAPYPSNCSHSSGPQGSATNYKQDPSVQSRHICFQHTRQTLNKTLPSQWSTHAESEMKAEELS